MIYEVSDDASLLLSVLYCVVPKGILYVNVRTREKWPDVLYGASHEPDGIILTVGGGESTAKHCTVTLWPENAIEEAAFQGSLAERGRRYGPDFFLIPHNTWTHRDLREPSPPIVGTHGRPRSFTAG